MKLNGNDSDELQKMVRELTIWKNEKAIDNLNTCVSYGSPLI